MVNYKERLDRTFAAFVDPTRRAILARLEREGGATVSELAKPFAIADGTELTFTHSRLRGEETRRSHEEGWNGALGKQRHFLASANGGRHDQA